MNNTELRRAIEQELPKARKHPMSTFDVEFLGYIYLSALYDHRILNRMPRVLSNIRQLPRIGAIVLFHKPLLSPTLASRIPSDGVPTKAEAAENYELLSLEGLLSGKLRQRVEDVLAG